MTKENVPSVANDIFDVKVYQAIDRIADVMANAQLVPQHLQKKKSDCFVVAQQAHRWGMDPFAVAQCTSIVKGKLCFEGKLVAAVVDALAGVKLDYKYNGSGENKEVTVSGTRKGETEPKELTIKLKDVKTDNIHWKKSDEQMLAYRGSREWVRRYEPACLLGIYTEDEMIDARDVIPQDNSKLEEAFLKKDEPKQIESKPNGALDELLDTETMAKSVEEPVVVEPKEKKPSLADSQQDFVNKFADEIRKMPVRAELDAHIKANRMHIDALDEDAKTFLRSLIKEQKNKINNIKGIKELEQDGN